MRAKSEVMPSLAAEDPSLLVLNGTRDEQETQERQEELQTG